MPAVIAICLRYLTYDPNYNFDDEDEDDNAMDAEQNDEDYQGGRGGVARAGRRGRRADVRLSLQGVMTSTATTTT